MRALVVALASLTAVVTVTIPKDSVARAAVQPQTRSRITLANEDVTATLRGSEANGRRKLELDLTVDAVRARLFSNTGVIGDFSGSRLRLGRAVRSPYLAALGVGDGFTSRVTTGRMVMTGAFVSGPKGISVAGELAAFEGAFALQGGYKASGGDTGSTSFAGAHVDFDVLHAVVSVRWHAGREEIVQGTRDTSAGSVAVGLASVLEDDDRLRAAMSRPVRPEYDFDYPDFHLFYSLPMAVGRLSCAGGVENHARRSTVKLSWRMSW